MKCSDIPDSRLLRLIADKSDPETGRPTGEPWPDEVLREEGVPWKVIAAKFDKYERRGLIDYGSSPHLGWLTDKGWALLAELEQ